MTMDMVGVLILVAVVAFIAGIACTFWVLAFTAKVDHTPPPPFV